MARGFDPWLGNFHMQWEWPKKKINENKKMNSVFDLISPSIQLYQIDVVLLIL